MEAKLNPYRYEVVTSYDYIKGMAHRFEPLPIIELSIDGTLYELEVYRDHFNDTCLFVLIMRDTTACKPIVIANMTFEVMQDTLLRDLMVARQIRKHEAE